MSIADQIAKLEAAIAAQEELRPLLGDESVDTAVAALRAQLELLQARHGASVTVSAALAGTPRRQTGARHPADRRNVTVLIADLHGFTALSERFDPEIIREFQDDLFDEIASTVHANEGFIEKFVGDAVVAIFGAPTAHEDDPERALRAALGMMQRMEGINERWTDRLGGPVQIHIGINTGTVVAGEIGPQGDAAYSVTGDTINTASRLQSAAQPGQILVSAATHRLTDEAFDFEQLEPVRVQGKRDPLTVFELRRAKLYPEKSRGVSGLRSPLVGRDAELDRLRGVIGELEAGRGQVVILSGEAGIGKSRLMAEWRAGLPAGVRWLEGRSYAASSGVPYGPFADLIRRYASITDEDSEARARRRLRMAIERILPSGLEPNAIVAGMLGMRPEPAEASYLATLTPEALRQRLFTLVSDLFSRLAKQRPTVLALEDLHWADGSSLELLEHLLPLVLEVPVAIVAVLRPGEPEGEPRLLPVVSDRYADRLTRLELAPLATASTQTLVEELLSSSEALPPAAQHLIIGKAEGNPFFVEEVIRSLIERGGLVRAEDGSRWIVTPVIDSIRVPDTLQGVLIARLDGLPPHTRLTAQEAAVIGRVFQYRLLLRIAEDGDGLETDLDRLSGDELIQELRRDPELEYRFKHALTQEAAYESLLGPQRRDLHARVGVALESLAGDRIGELHAILGNHFLRGEVWDKAAHYFTQAGDAAARLHAYPEARGHYARALQALAALPPNDENRRRIVDLTLSQMGVSWGAENPERHLSMLAEAETLAETLANQDGSTVADRARLARIHYWIGRIHYYRDDPRQAIGYFQRVLQVGQELGDEELLAIPLAVMGRALVVQGHFGKAAPLLARAIGPLERAGEAVDWSFSKGYHAVAITAMGQYEAGRVEAAEAVADAKSTGNPTALAGTFIVQAFQAFLGRDDAAFRDAGHNAATTGADAGNALMTSVGLAWEAWGLSRLGEHEAAEERMAKSRAEAEKIGGRLVAADWVAAANAELALNAGQLEDAITRAQTSIEMSRAIGGIFGEGLAQRIWGLALARMDPPQIEPADQRLAASLQLFEAGECRIEIAHTHVEWGLVCRERGEDAAAAEHLRVAAEQLEAAGLASRANEARVALEAAEREVHA